MPALIGVLVGGCVEQAAPGGAGQPRVRSQTRPGKSATAPARILASTRYADGSSGISFVAPAGLRIETEHFEPGPAGQMRHRVVLSRDRLERLAVEVWDNPTSLPVGPWFEQHLSFVRDGHERVSWRMLSSHRVRGMLIRQPRSPQAFGQRMAIFSAGGKVVRVTCLNEDVPATLAAFQQVVSTVAVKGAR